MTPLDQLRLRLTDHDFDRLMQAAKPVPVPDRDAFVREVAAEVGRHEVVGPGLLHRVMSEVQRRYIGDEGTPRQNSMFDHNCETILDDELGGGPEGDR